MQDGDFVRINYVGRLESGEIFDLTDEERAKNEKVYNARVTYRPIPIIVGAGFVISGLDHAIKTMQVGDKKTIHVQPDDAFGKRDPSLVQILQKRIFHEQNAEPYPGLIVNISGRHGRVQSVDGGRVRVDFNNPLAGKVLSYDLEITEQIEGDENKLRSILEFFGVHEAPVAIEQGEAKISVELPTELKKRISELILTYIKTIQKVSFVATYSKVDKKEE